MWVFLVTEIMFFGGLFLAYIVYRSRYPEAFAPASHHLDVPLGAINTAVLIGSSFTMALAVRAAQHGRQTALLRWLLATMVLGSVFLGIKAFEYARQVGPPPRPRAALRLRGSRRPEARRALLLALLRDDRPARAAHGHRRGTPRLARGANAPRSLHRGLLHAGRAARASTGTSSTSSGSSSSRCST